MTSNDDQIFIDIILFWCVIRVKCGFKHFQILDNLKQLVIRIKPDWLKHNVKREQMHIKTKGFFSHNIFLSRATMSKEATC